MIYLLFLLLFLYYLLFLLLYYYSLFIIKGRDITYSPTLRNFVPKLLCIIFIIFYLLFYLLHVANTLCWTSITNRHRKFPTPREISRNLCSFSHFWHQAKPDPVCILVQGWPQGSRLTQTSSAPRQASDDLICPKAGIWSGTQWPQASRRLAHSLHNY